VPARQFTKVTGFTGTHRNARRKPFLPMGERLNGAWRAGGGALGHFRLSLRVRSGRQGLKRWTRAHDISVCSGLDGLAYRFGRALLPGSSVTGQDQGSAGRCYCLQRSRGLPGVVCCCGSDDLRAGLSGVWVQGHQCIPAEDGPPVREVKNAVTVSVARGVYDGRAPGHRHAVTASLRTPVGQWRSAPQVRSWRVI
jgi:hypothetical protein